MYTSVSPICLYSYTTAYRINLPLLKCIDIVVYAIHGHSLAWLLAMNVEYESTFQSALLLILS